MGKSHPPSVGCRRCPLGGRRCYRHGHHRHGRWLLDSLSENERQGFALRLAVFEILFPCCVFAPSMRTRQIVTLLLSAALFGILGGPGASAQTVRVEAGGGWAIPSSSVDMPVQGQNQIASVNPGSGPQVYAALRLVWTVSDNLTLESGVRAQQSMLRGSTDDFGCDACTYSNDPDGRLRGLTVEGHLMLTSVGRIKPYFLVGLGVVRTTVDGVLVTTPEGNEVQFSEVDVTDAGGDVGFGATTRVVGGLFLTAETRVTGSLPGAKENAITTFPFTLGLSYRFGDE